MSTRIHSRSSLIHLPLTALVAAGLLVGCSGSEAEAQPQAQPPVAAATPASKPAPVRPIRPGDAFPAGVYRNLNGGGQVDLTQVVGKKPVMLCYWIAGNPRTETFFQQISELVSDIGGDRVSLYGVAVPRPGQEAAAISARIAEIGISHPVIEDEGYQIGQLLSVRSAPNLTLIDSEGKVRLSNGASLNQVLGYKLDLGGAIKKLAETGNLITYGVLDRYYPVKELEGTACPDFKAPLIKDKVEQRLHNLLARDKLNALIFWSVDCPHCREELPEINRWLKQNPGEVNVISAANVSTEASRIKTRDFCQANGFEFPTLVDQDARIGEQFLVTSTPTILLIGPDGVIASAITSAQADFARVIAEAREKLDSTGS